MLHPDGVLAYIRSRCWYLLCDSLPGISRDSWILQQMLLLPANTSGTEAAIRVKDVNEQSFGVNTKGTTTGIKYFVTGWR